MVFLEVRHFLFMAAGAMALAGPLQAQTDYPSKSTRMIVPFAPGGSADLTARVLAQKLTEQMPFPVVIENKPGANMSIGAELVAKAPADGYTALFNTSNMIFNIALYTNLSYDVFRDFAPVGMVGAVPQVLVVNNGMPVHNLRELLAHVRANPGKFNFASVGVGAIGHITSALFLNANKLSAQHIPYNGTPQVYADLIGGRVHFYFGTVASASPFIKDNRVRPIAVTSLERSKGLPDVPSLNESGMPGFEATSWMGVLLPSKSSQGIVSRLNAEMVKALKSPDLNRQFENQGTFSITSTPGEYAAYIKSEADKWGKIIREEKIRPE